MNETNGHEIDIQSNEMKRKRVKNMNLQLILRANKPKFSLQCSCMKESSIKFMEEFKLQ